MKKRILSRDGFTLAESIIAMVIISLVTVTAVTLILSSTHTTQSAVQKAQAQYFAEDALTCFRAADSADRFVDAIAFSGGYTELSVTGDTYVFTLADSRFRAVALVEYPTDGRASFSIEILDDDEDVITSISQFRKGD